jgi:hypothetical protein
VAPVRSWLRTHGTLAAAVLLGLAVTVPYALMAWSDFMAARDPSRIDGDFGRGLGGLAMGGGAEHPSVALYITAAIEAFVVIMVLIALGRVSLRLEDARGPAIALFSLLGAVALSFAIASLFGDQSTPGSAVGAVSGVVCLGVVALLAAPATADDFLEKERARIRADVDRKALR